LFLVSSTKYFLRDANLCGPVTSIENSNITNFG